MYSLDFRLIPGFPSYAITRAGVVVRLTTQGGRFKGNTLRQYLDDGPKARIYVRLCEKGRPIKKYVHALVAETWIGTRGVGMEVDHKDTDRTNNAAGNLEYVTRRENLRRYHASGAAERDRAKYYSSARYQQRKAAA